MAQYQQVLKTVNALQFTGDVSAIEAFGVTVIDQSNPLIQIVINTKNGSKMCAINNYVYKDANNNVDTMTEADFLLNYQAI